jgi:ATP-dependent helicase/nuclease subunit B
VLRDMTLADQMAILDAAIGEGLGKIANLSASDWDDAYVTMQRERLRRLLRPWLEHELARPWFAVKQREEKADNVQIGPLHLSLRVDRVDETRGGELLIDYKTGRVSTSDWLSERPDAPQLPLYAVMSDATRLGGVAFARLRVGKDMGLKGFAARDGVLLKLCLAGRRVARGVDEIGGAVCRRRGGSAAEELSEDLRVLRAETPVPGGRGESRGDG